MENLVIDRSFWQNKSVLVTGHTGFKGSWLSLWLKKLGAKVVGYSLKPDITPSLFEDAKVGDRLISIEGDIRDLKDLSRVIESHSPEIIFHLAAQAYVDKSYKLPVETYTTNLIGTLNLFEAIRQTATKCVVINVTTDKCYENREWVWPYRESDLLGGYDPYSSSKACVEIMTAAYRNSFFNLDKLNIHGVSIANARAGNVIGGGDWANNRLVPDVLRAFDEGRSVAIRNPNAIRPWQHVMEALRGYLLLAQQLERDKVSYSGAWNFGPSHEDARSVFWIVSHLEKMIGCSWSLSSSDNVHEANYLKLDSSKAAVELSWRPNLNLIDALNLTVEWHKKRKSGVSAFDITMNQIEYYEELSLTKAAIE